MSFARSRVGLSVASRVLATSRVTSAQSSLIAFRMLSTTPRLLHAEPIHVKHQNTFSPEHLDPTKSPANTGTYSAAQDPSKFVNPYKGKQGAVDKAVHLFFFTEIIRGALECSSLLREDLWLSRHVDCYGELLPGSVHYHVPLREGTAFSAFQRRARVASVSQRRGALHRLVRFTGNQHAGCSSFNSMQTL